jgi:hypothetical protein
MELILSDDFDFEIGPDCEIEFPKYVRRLPDDELEIALSSEDKHLRIVAAGADPDDQKIMLFTAEGKIRIFDAKSYYIPSGPAFPCQDGLKIFLENTSGRWPGPTKGFFVDSSWLLEKSESALKGAKLSTPTYNHENDAK